MKNISFRGFGGVIQAQKYSIDPLVGAQRTTAARIFVVVRWSFKVFQVGLLEPHTIKNNQNCI